MRLSVLDQSTVSRGQRHDAAIRDTIAMARHCERLGYHRFWMSEHHALPSIAGSSPEILIAAVASVTSQIRVGSAGILLPNYSPYKVAEQFRTLEAIAPGRIDMGLGRAPGGDMRTAQALHPNVTLNAQNFPNNVRDLLAWLRDEELRPSHPQHGLPAFPQTPSAPEPWMLGSSTGGARIAAELGIPYCFAHFITQGEGAREALDLYRHFYQPSAHYPEPRAMVCVWALAADSEEEAHHLFKTRERALLNRNRGRFEPLQAPEEVAAQPYSAQETRAAELYRRQALLGNDAQVAEQLKALGAELDVEEIAVLTWTFDLEARQRSYALLAERFGLERRDDR